MDVVCIIGLVIFIRALSAGQHVSGSQDLEKRAVSVPIAVRVFFIPGYSLARPALVVEYRICEICVKVQENMDKIVY